MNKKQYQAPISRCLEISFGETILAGAASGNVNDKFDGGNGNFSTNDGIDLRPTDDEEIEIR